VVQNDKVILIVDDCPDLRDLVKETIESILNYEVLEAEDGLEALKVIKQNRIDCIISDWNMPVMDGLSLLKKIRAEARYRDMPFMMLTGEMSRGSVETAISSGVNDFLIKPFSTDSLCEKVDKLLGKRKVC
jgi:two-component system chemotaxis response regulator CheY